MKSIGFLTHAVSLRVLGLLQGPRGRIQSAPSVTTGREPRPPIADVFQAAGGQQAAFELVPISGAFGFADDPIRSGQHSRDRAAQPGFIAREAEMLHQAPKNPAVMLIVTAVFIPAGAVEDAILRGEIAGQTDRSLIAQPGVEALLGFLVIAAPIQVHNHHAGLIAVSAVVERAHPGKTQGVVWLALAVDEQMTGVSAIKLV